MNTEVAFQQDAGFGGFGFSKSLPAQAGDDAEKTELLLQLAELQKFITQEETVLLEAGAAQQQLEDRVVGLRHAVEKAEVEFLQRGHVAMEAQQRREEEEERRLISLRCHGRASIDDHEEHIPEDMLRELEELHVELEQLQDRHEFLQQALQQATQALDDANESARPSSPSKGGCQNQAAQAEIEELEAELERLVRREAKLNEEQRNRRDQLQEEVLYVQCHSRDERWVLKEDIQNFIAEGEVLEAEIEGIKLGTQRALAKLEKEERSLKRQVDTAQANAESRTSQKRATMQQLKLKCKSLKEATEEARRLSSQELRPKAPKSPRGSAKKLRIGGVEDCFASPRGSRKSPRESLVPKRKTLFDELNDSPSPSPMFSPRPEDEAPDVKKKMTLFDELDLSKLDDADAYADDAASDGTRATQEKPKSLAPSPRELAKSSSVEPQVQGRPKQSIQTLGPTADAAYPAPEPSSSSSARAPRISMARLPPTQQGSAPGNDHEEFLTITLDKTSGTSLGIGVDQELTITAIEDEGLLAGWNGTHSLSSVCPGYKIVEVNGRTEFKKMIKQLKLHCVLEIKLQWKGLAKPQLGTLNRQGSIQQRSSQLRRARSSNLGFNYNGAVRINLDDDDDTESVNSSGSGQLGGADIGNALLSGTGGLGAIGGASAKKLSIIGEDSTITGDGSSQKSSDAGDATPPPHGDDRGALEASRKDSAEEIVSNSTPSANDVKAECSLASSPLPGTSSEGGAPQAAEPSVSPKEIDPALAVDLAVEATDNPPPKRNSRLEELRPSALASPDSETPTNKTFAESLASELVATKQVDTTVVPASTPKEDSPTVSADGQTKQKEINSPEGCRGVLEWSMREPTAALDEPLMWANPRFFEVATDQYQRWVLHSRPNEASSTDGSAVTAPGELEIALLAITAVRLDRRDPDERTFSVRHRAGNGERVECLFRASNPKECIGWTRGLMAVITDLRRGGAEVKLAPRLKAAAQAVVALRRAAPKGKS